ncbi:FAD-binding oxidoreductase [Ramlibacter solisilvae]|uniref:FAD-linked oxidase n=1 Tax=Ramlibacter tataouinensis TaxID=94132 RepID=A0A127JX18_9BURK|nr:FAD-binding oxidoreductase [Ramlibacter tataouinensis]AMO24429.1 FAD-linked oxidase [Ramlibacter tataouinensis]
MLLHGWGRYPRSECDIAFPASESECAQSLGRRPLIPRGMGRSYGDSSLGDAVISTRYLDHFRSFDPATGLLRCAAGVTLADVLRTFVPKGWFPAVTPGTSFVSIGGAIASDVHGKNHHRDGTFTDHLLEMEVLLGDGRRVKASRTENEDLFHATCGGMGLTGIILEATLRLRPLPSGSMVQTALKLPHLDAALEAFETHAQSSYSVAWIDCTAHGPKLGRSVLFLGEHDTQGPLDYRERTRLAVPIEAPSFATGSTALRCFNALYYARARAKASTRRVSLADYFYPLDAIQDWNRLYGRAGLLQHQFVLPVQSAARGLRTILERVAASGCGSFLAVLKKFGAANDHFLSFPMAGYTLALDFKAGPRELALLDALDEVVIDHGGRIYLAKDARMTQQVFRASYPRWHEFEAVRARWNAHGRFASRQSRRLGLQ